MRTIIVVVLGSLLGSCGPAPSVLEQILQYGELRVITKNSPATYYYGADESRGIEFELARGFAERLGVELKLSTAGQSWQLFPTLANGDVHLAAAGLTISEQQLAAVDFGPRYQRVRPQLIFRMGNKRPRSLAELSGKLEVLAGSDHVDLLLRESLRVPDLRWTERPATSAEALLRRVVERDIDYAIVDSNEFELLRHYYAETLVAFDLAADTDVAWALPKGADALREEVAAYFAEIEANGKLDEILNRYYYAARDFDFVGSRTFVRHLNSRLPRYQHLFEEAESETGINWRLLAAIAYQESHWNSDAVSPTGVRGLMMLTRKTASMMDVDDRVNARESILGGARYFQRVLNKFPERIPEEDRLLFAVAAYNVGFGHVEDARIITEIQGGNIDSWQDVRERLPLLAEEEWYSRVRRGYAPGSVPVSYTHNVRRYFALLGWMAGTEILSSAQPIAHDRLIAAN